MSQVMMNLDPARAALPRLTAAGPASRQVSGTGHAPGVASGHEGTPVHEDRSAPRGRRDREAVARPRAGAAQDHRGRRLPLRRVRHGPQRGGLHGGRLPAPPHARPRGRGRRRRARRGRRAPAGRRRRRRLRPVGLRPLPPLLAGQGELLRQRRGRGHQASRPRRARLDGRVHDRRRPAPPRAARRPRPRRRTSRSPTPASRRTTRSRRSLPKLGAGTFAVVIGTGGLGHVGIQILKALSGAHDHRPRRQRREARARHPRRRATTC